MLADLRADARRAATLAAEVMLGNYRRQVREALTVADPRRRVLLERITSAATAHPWPVGEVRDGARLLVQAIDEVTRRGGSIADLARAVRA